MLTPGAAPSDPGYATPAAYPVIPPTIAYGEPENSFWELTATFGGGAVVGGLLGLGLNRSLQ